MHLTPPLDAALIDQSQVGLVDQGCRLQRVADLLLVEVAVGQGAQLIVDKREYLLCRLRGIFRVITLRENGGDGLSIIVLGHVNLQPKR